MVEDGFAAQVEHFQQARLHGGLRKESNSHPSYTVPIKRCKRCGDAGTKVLSS
jgi:hypothetical protein